MYPANFPLPGIVPFPLFFLLLFAFSFAFLLTEQRTKTATATFCCCSAVLSSSSLSLFFLSLLFLSLSPLLVLMTEVYVERVVQAALCGLFQAETSSRNSSSSSNSSSGSVQQQQQQQPQQPQQAPLWLRAVSVGVVCSGQQCRIPRYGLAHALHLLQTTDACPASTAEAADPVLELATLISSHIRACDSQRIIKAVDIATTANPNPNAPVVFLSMRPPLPEEHAQPLLRPSQRTMAVIAQLARVFCRGIAPYCEDSFLRLLKDVGEKLKHKPPPTSPVLLTTAPPAAAHDKPNLRVKDEATQLWLQHIMSFHAAADNGHMPEDLYGDLCGLVQWIQASCLKQERAVVGGGAAAGGVQLCLEVGAEAPSQEDFERMHAHSHTLNAPPCPFSVICGVG